MKKSGLTEKSMSNKHFYKTEQAILIAYYKLKDFPKACKIAKQAGISRSTFYRHHSSAYSIPYDYEAYLFSLYSYTIQKLLRRSQISVKLAYLRTLAFISNHRDLFKILFSENRKEVIKKMLHRLRPLISQSWPASCNTDQAFNIYANEVLALIELWGKHDFSVSMLSSTLSEVLYLTKTAPRHLSPIAKL